MTLRSIGDLEVISPYPKLLHAKFILGSTVPELLDMRIIRLLKAFTPAWVINTVSFTLKIGFIHHSGSFEILEANFNVPYRSVPRALNKHYSARGEAIHVSFMYIN